MKLRPLVHLCLISQILFGCSDEQAVDPLSDLQLVRSHPSDLPLPGLSGEWFDRFTRGDALFERAFRPAQGLGPVFIRQSCNSCHASDARGPGVVRKMVVVESDGRTPASDQSRLPYGHTVRPQLAAGAQMGVTVPDDHDDILVTKRDPPAVFGRGYLEAVMDAEIMRVEAEQADGGIVSGRINWVQYNSESNPDQRFHAYTHGERLVGRFGLKARIASLDEFAADAFQGDMGITSELRPFELPNPAGADDDLPGIDLDSEMLNSVADYMRLLALPARLPDSEDPRGKALFAQAGCADCHVPQLHTRADYPIEALADVDAPLYTDMLLHDMGAEFSDGLPEYDADASEWRTPPLIGLHHIRRYLHDGRASTLEEAVEMHSGSGSEAEYAVARYNDLAATDRATLVRFVSAL